MCRYRTDEKPAKTPELSLLDSRISRYTAAGKTTAKKQP